jgi:hypothetical protein
LAALVLLAVNALFLLLTVLDFILALGGDGFTARANAHFESFVGLTSIALPLIAVLIATHIRPVVPHGRMITVLAIAEYAVSGLFGLIAIFAGFLGTLVNAPSFDSDGAVRQALTGFLGRIGMFALLALAAFLVLRVYLGLYSAPRPAHHPGYPPYGQAAGYGYPQGAGHAYPQGAGQPYPQAAGHAHPQYGPPEASPQPAHGQPGNVQPETAQPANPQPGNAQAGHQHSGQAPPAQGQHFGSHGGEPDYGNTPTAMNPAAGAQPAPSGQRDGEPPTQPLS